MSRVSTPAIGIGLARRGDQTSGSGLRSDGGRPRREEPTTARMRDSARITDGEPGVHAASSVAVAEPDPGEPANA